MKGLGSGSVEAGMHTLGVSLLGCKAIDSGLAGDVALRMVYDRNLHNAVAVAEMLAKNLRRLHLLEPSSPAKRLSLSSKRLPEKL